MNYMPSIACSIRHNLAFDMCFSSIGGLNSIHLSCKSNGEPESNRKFFGDFETEKTP